MATVYGVSSTKANFGKTQATTVTQPAQELDGVIRRTGDRYEASAAASGTRIVMGFVPAGAIFERIVVRNDALGSDVTLKVALDWVDGSTPTDLIAATASSSAGAFNTDTTTYTDTIGQGTATAKAAYLTVVVGGAAATGTITASAMFATAA